MELDLTSCAMGVIDTDKVDHYPMMEDVVDILCSRTDNDDRHFFRVVTAFFLAKMASSMRATVITKNRGPMPVNQYSLALADSGYGKGTSVEVLEEEFTKHFKYRFMNDTFPVITEQSLWNLANINAARNNTQQQEEFDIALKAFKNQGPFPFTFDSGTTPAVKQLRQKLLMSACGAISMQIDEIGWNLVNTSEVLTLFLELYDHGKVKQKLIKNSTDNKREEDLDGKTPANILMFGTPQRLLDGSQVEDLFYAFLQAGHARRCLFAYGQKVAKEHDINIDPLTLYKQKSKAINNDVIDKISRHFHSLADPSAYNWEMIVEDDAGAILTAYETKCVSLARQLPDHEEVRRNEMENRFSKALKLAGVYAFVDQSTEVEPEHMLAAIKLVEDSAKALGQILNREKSYVKLAKYIAEVGTEVTHADLHEKLPFYKASQTQRNEMMTMATSWGYKNHIIIKKHFVDGIELFKGETLQETDLSKMIVSYSDNWAYNYLNEEVAFDQLHKLTQAEGMHWVNHHFQKGHRATENVIQGCNLVVVDVDEGVSLQSAYELMKDYKFLIYTTKRHTQENHRFRMILPTNYRIELDAQEYREFMNGILSWIPFKTDEAANQIAKKWESYSGGGYQYNMEGKLFDVLDFIPKTSRNETYQKQTSELKSLDNLERWFAQRIANGNRNNQMLKYAMTLVDSGWEYIQVSNQVRAFNSKLNDPLDEAELQSTVMVSVAKKYQKIA